MKVRFQDYWWQRSPAYENRKQATAVDLFISKLLKTPVQALSLPSIFPNFNSSGVKASADVIVEGEKPYGVCSLNNYMSGVLGQWISHLCE